MIAPDLLGHGRSAKPRGDYSLGAYASGIRDLLGVLGFERGTVVGHSLGGGIAMQFAYQFPEYSSGWCWSRSGGLGREVHPLLRAATLPGSELVHAADRPRLGAYAPAASVARASGQLRRARPGATSQRWRAATPRSSNADAREAFLHTLRGGDRPRRAEGQRAGPPLSRRADADPDHLGRTRPDHPRRSTAAPRTRRFPTAAWSRSTAPATGRSSISRRLVSDELTGFIAETEPFEFDLDRMREQLRQGPRSTH